MRPGTTTCGLRGMVMMRHAVWAAVMLASACGTPSTPMVDEAVPVEDTVEAEPEVTTADALTLLARLRGDWMDDSGRGRYRFHETWQAAGDSGLAGTGVALSGTDTVFIEELSINWYADGRIIYAARIGSQNDGQWVPFDLVHGTDSLVFSNPNHDFPRRIAYRPEGKGWRVHVSGEEESGQREEHFHFRRR